MAASTTLHEAPDQLSARTIDVHRAIVSLMEELEACKDAQLQAVLKHNRDEEIEHASMTLEWIRRNFPKFDEALKTYLFTQGDITKIEENAENGKEETAKQGPNNSRLTVGAMKGS